MKVGYSLLWVKFLQAADLNYSLTTDLQVVCPCCNEFIFKVERRLGDSGLINYFSIVRSVTTSRWPMSKA